MLLKGLAVAILLPVVSRSGGGVSGVNGALGFGSLSAREPMADSEVIDKAWLFTLGAGVLSYCDAHLTSR